MCKRRETPNPQDDLVPRKRKNDNVISIVPFLCFDDQSLNRWRIRPKKVLILKVDILFVRVFSPSLPNSPFNIVVTADHTTEIYLEDIWFWAADYATNIH